MSLCVAFPPAKASHMHIDLINAMALVAQCVDLELAAGVQIAGQQRTEPKVRAARV
jgi:hypothetical protein